MRGISILFGLTLTTMASVSFATADKIDSNVYDPYTPQNYPKTFKTWGKKGAASINKYRVLAAEEAIKNPRCDFVETSELSDNRSSPPNNVVIFVDCRNGERFYLSSAEIDAKSGATSIKERTVSITDHEAIQQCEAAVVRMLKFPSSFDKGWFSSNVQRASQGNVVVTFDFSAKNGLGIDLPQGARCVFDDRGMHLPEITNR
ncbi:hypothetical protein KUG47_12160 [Falsochrobactrum sp. TDYN1]|uniref:Uncharacterized protein n=1 Tax=Falsochrobactrum tianjinense TaxID=2706015 RepID=A0A949PN89_9HYPH|nr:hypothetical protein [Falsochrobactrum sp. TDYN1]MBV2144248.1 hypothetical protein [Falsochrobactrum sp. TDYN1]